MVRTGVFPQPKGKVCPVKEANSVEGLDFEVSEEWRFVLSRSRSAGSLEGSDPRIGDKAVMNRALDLQTWFSSAFAQCL